MNSLKLLATLWPSFPHFQRFARDSRLDGIRLNSAMMNIDELDTELGIVAKTTDAIPLYFDIKGRQLRVREVHNFPDHLELTLNHPIQVQTPVMVLFKAGNDQALLEKVVEGKRLIFVGGPKWKVKEGESLHIRHPSFQMLGGVFPSYEIEKIRKVRKAGFTRYFLSYVETQREIDECREYIGKDAELVLKIETRKGLDFVADYFKKDGQTALMAARGDLYVEIDKPHQIMEAMRVIIEKDAEAMVGSRIMLSVVKKEWDRETGKPILKLNPVPECADFLELAWMYDIGYRRMMLCDELCLEEKLLANAVSALHAFKETYAIPRSTRPIHKPVTSSPWTRIKDWAKDIHQNAD
jgi:hypothetical protein